jgi:glutaredoxin
VLKVRIVSSDNCPICKRYLTRLDKRQFSYEVLDADAKEHQDELNARKIFDLPVVLIVDANGVIKHQFPHGEFSPRAINAKIKMLGG